MHIVCFIEKICFVHNTILEHIIVTMLVCSYIFFINHSLRILGKFLDFFWFRPCQAECFYHRIDKTRIETSRHP